MLEGNDIIFSPTTGVRSVEQASNRAAAGPAQPDLVVTRWATGIPPSRCTICGEPGKKCASSPRMSAVANNIFRFCPLVAALSRESRRALDQPPAAVLESAPGLPEARVPGAVTLTFVPNSVDVAGSWESGW